MTLYRDTLSATVVASPDIFVRVRSAAVTVVTYDFARYLELMQDKPKPQASCPRQAYLDCSASVHVCQADFQVGKHARSTLILLLASSPEEPREHVIWMPSSLFLGFMLFQPFLAVPVVDAACLSCQLYSIDLPCVGLFELTSCSDRTS